ncbi:MAG: AI-2E family transporter [Lentisphaeria bacterium]|nr:AI-2E family transporter [Lentisphaeria bacterium]NQZ67913.1 AI-2E family transporter [Lentisphaeria bacterium]
MNEKKYYQALIKALSVFGLIFLVIIPLAVTMLYICRSLVTPVISALLIAYILFPLVRWFSSIGIPRSLCIIIIVFSMIGSGVFLALRVVPAVNTEVKALIPADDDTKNEKNGTHSQAIEESRIIKTIKGISDQLFSYGILTKQFSSEEIKASTIDLLAEKSTKLLAGLGVFSIALIQFLMIFFFVLVFALHSGRNIYKFLIGVLPNSIFEAGVFTLNKTTIMFGNYLRGVVLETLILWGISLVLIIPLCVMTGLSFFMALAITIAIAGTNVVRIIGPIVGGILSVFLVLTATTDLLAIFMVIGIVVITQLLDNILVLPLVMRGQLEVHPVLCLLGVLSGGMIGGVLGMIMAIPIISGIKVVHRVITIELKKFNIEHQDEIPHYDEAQV